jgi:hypothetical protein
MAQALKYKKPRRINSVSVALALFALVAGYLAWQYFPLFMQKQEAFRILEETGSSFSGRRCYYLEDADASEALRRRLENDLRRVGIRDPDLETWIELEEHEARFGAVYSVFIEWPKDVLPKQQFDYQVEHVVNF